MKRRLLIAGILLLVLLVVSPLALWAQTGRPPWAVGAYLFSDEVKVVLGGPREPSEANMVQYTASRQALLRELAQQEPDREVQAVLVFNDFLSPDETAALVEKHHLKTEEIYLAVPYMEGGGGATVFSSIQGAYHAYIQGMKGYVKGRAEELPSSYLKRAQAVIDGQARIYAVRVRGRLADLTANVGGPVRLVDLFSAPEVEAAAQLLGKPVHYVISPVRPDGLP